MSSGMFGAVAEICSSRFGIARDDIKPDASFEDLGLDSLSQIELATAIKKKFGVEISDDEIADISTVSEVAAKLDEKLTSREVAG